MIEYYKTVNELPAGYADKLKEYLQKNCNEFFVEENHAKHVSNIVRFPECELKFMGYKFRNWDELVLIDLSDPERGEDLGYRYEDGHSYFICRITPSHRVTRLQRVIDIRNEFQKSDRWRNGYFLLPKI